MLTNGFLEGRGGTGSKFYCEGWIGVDGDVVWWWSTGGDFIFLGGGQEVCTLHV